VSVRVFGSSGISGIQIEGNNGHLSVTEPFLLDFCGNRLIVSLRSLSEVRIPETVKMLCDSAFIECKSLKAIWIPSNVETISTRCFCFCSKLTNVTFESGSKLSVIEIEVFSSCESLTSFHIPCSSSRIDGSAFLATPISTITIDGNNCHFSFSSPFLMDFEGISIIRYFGSMDEGEGEVTIPKQIRKLSRCCFQSCSSVHRVIFDSNAELLVIEESAFLDSGLESISIPRSVVGLEEKCFAACRRLKVLSFEAGAKLADIGKYLCCKV
jgi:hypothetical protein